MIAKLEPSIARLRRRAGIAAYLGALERHATIALFLFGGAALLGRTAFDLTREQALWILLGVLIAPVTAWLRARRAFLSDQAAAAWLDLRSGGDGSVVTALETDDERWHERVERALARNPALPRVRVERAALHTMPAVAFVLFVFWLDLPKTVLGPSPELYDAATERLEEKLAVLEELVELEEEQADELKAQLEQLEAEAQEGTPESFFEAADALEEAMEELAQELAEEAQDMSESLSAVMEASEAESEAAEATLRETMEEMKNAGLVANIPQDLSDKFPDGMDFPEGSELPEGVTLDGALMKELSEELRELLREKLSELAKAGLLKKGKLGEAGEGKLADLSKYEKSAGEPCDCEPCKKAGRKTSSSECKGDEFCHNKPCMDAGECQGGGT